MIHTVNQTPLQSSEGAIWAYEISSKAQIKDWGIKISWRAYQKAKALRVGPTMELWRCSRKSSQLTVCSVNENWDKMEAASSPSNQAWKSLMMIGTCKWVARLYKKPRGTSWSSNVSLWLSLGKSSTTLVAQCSE